MPSSGVRPRKAGTRGIEWRRRLRKRQSPPCRIQTRRQKPLCPAANKFQVLSNLYPPVTQFDELSAVRDVPVRRLASPHHLKPRVLHASFRKPRQIDGLSVLFQFPRWDKRQNRDASRGWSSSRRCRSVGERLRREAAP